MKKQKVLIVHNYYQIPGGEDSVVENEKKMLLDHGHEVIMYTRHNSEIAERGIIGRLKLPFESIFSIKSYREINRIIRKENIDIVHVHNTLPLISPSVYYSAIKYKIPVIQTIHNFRFLCPGATFFRNGLICEECLKKGLICSIKNRCYRGSVIQSSISAMVLGFHRLIGTYNKINAYIALTEFNKEKLMNLIDEEKIFIKPNFVKQSGFISDNNKRNNFLFVGRLDEVKGIQMLVEAWKNIKGDKLIVVGTGPLEEYIREYIKINKIENIEILGFKNKEEVMKLISNSKALIVPSQWYEGFPMTIVEGLSVGTPIIASNIGNLSKVIKNYYNGLLFSYTNKEDLKDKINIIQNNEALVDDLSKGAIKDYRKNYTEEKNYKILLEIYDKCDWRKNGKV